QLARGKLMVQPIHRSVLQVSQRVVAGGAGQLMLGYYRLFQPGVGVIGRIVRRLAVDPVASLDGLASISPGRNSLGVYHLPLDVESADDEVVPGVFQVLKQ